MWNPNNSDELIDDHVRKRVSLKELSVKYGVTTDTIRYYLKSKDEGWCNKGVSLQICKI